MSGFTTDDLEHLLAVLRDHRETGDFHGKDRTAWWARHERLTREIGEAVVLSKADPDTTI